MVVLIQYTIISLVLRITQLIKWALVPPSMGKYIKLGPTLLSEHEKKLYDLIAKIMRKQAKVEAILGKHTDEIGHVRSQIFNHLTN